MSGYNISALTLPDGYSWGAHHSSGFASGYWVVRDRDGSAVKLFDGIGPATITAADIDEMIEERLAEAYVDDWQD